MNLSRFYLCPNCFPGFEQNIFWGYASKTEIRNISISAGADISYARPVIPEFMLDIPRGGKWKESIPDLESVLSEYGLKAVLVEFYGNFIGYPGSEVFVKRRIDFARRMGAGTVNVVCSVNLADSDKLVAYKVLREIGKYAQDNGIKVVTETYGGLTKNAEECLRTIDAVGDCGIKINYDIANVLRFNPDLCTAEKIANDLKRLSGCLGWMHLKDYDAETKSIVPLGDGLIDFPEIFRILDEMNFSGMIGLDLETTEACQIRTAEAHNNALQKSVNFLSKIL